MSVFAKDTFERAIKTFAQVLLTFFIGSVTVLNVNWVQALGVSGTAALVSVLSSFASGTFAKTGTASLANDPFLRGKHETPPN